MNRINAAAITSLAFLLGACGSMPELKVGYYHPKVSTSIIVTQTATCTAGNIGVLTTDIKTDSVYSSDYKNGREEFNLNGLGSGWSKADVTFAFYDDGRLKSVNSTQTGQAAEGLKALVSLAEALGVLVAFTDKEQEAACKIVRAAAGDGKALTIKSTGETSFDGSQIAFSQISVPAATYKALEPIFGTIAATVTMESPVIPHIAGTNNGSRPLALIAPRRAALHVIVLRGTQTLNYLGQVWVPQGGAEYSLPIQKGAWFGENTFELDLAESGRITKLRYSGLSGAAGAIGAITQAYEATEGPSLADQVNRAKAEADLIFQQQRLVLCQADPATCPK